MHVCFTSVMQNGQRRGENAHTTLMLHVLGSVGNLLCIQPARKALLTLMLIIASVGSKAHSVGTMMELNVLHHRCALPCSARLARDLRFIRLCFV